MFIAGASAVRTATGTPAGFLAVAKAILVVLRVTVGVELRALEAIVVAALVFDAGAAGVGAIARTRCDSQLRLRTSSPSRRLNLTEESRDGLICTGSRLSLTTLWTPATRQSSAVPQSASAEGVVNAARARTMELTVNDCLRDMMKVSPKG